MITHFQTFIDAFAKLSKPDRLLNGDLVLCPPRESFGYQSTPKNAVTFSEMGVDGVHTVILRLDGKVRDDSPIVYVSPMDSDDVIVLAGSFIHFLADGCSTSLEKMKSIFERERSGENAPVPFLATFDRSRLLGESRTRELGAKFQHMIQRNVDWKPPKPIEREPRRLTIKSRFY